MKLVEFSTRRRVTVAMLMVAIIAFGSVGFSRLAVNLLPDITYPTITVRTEYEGVAPLEIERLISEPVEGLVGVVSNVVRVSSISRPGISDVVVEFGWGTNMDFASLDIREKLDMANLPRDADKPILLRFDPSLDPIMRLAFYGNLSLMEMRRVAEERLRPDLESLEGVAAVRINGGLEEEIQVEVEAQRLAYLGISINQVTSRLAAENVNLTGGMLKDGEAEFLVRTLNEFQGIDEIGEIVVGQIDRAPIKLKDVGRVFRGHRERDLVTRINGREGVEVSVFKEGDANTVQVSAAVQERLDEFLAENATLLQDSGMEVVFNQAIFIQQSVDEVLNTAIIGGILAVIVLFLFLRDLKSTAIISLSIPLSVVATFFLMFGSDVSLNIMSLGGLALGVGMLVDNSIVVLESVQRYRDQGLNVLAAAVRGASEVGRAVIAATTTTICVFLPIVFVEGVAGQLFRDQALTVTYSLVASLVVALMLIPMLSSLNLESMIAEREEIGPKRGLQGPALLIRLIRAIARGAGRVFSTLLFPLYWLFDLVFNALNKAYPLLLSWALRRRLIVIAIFIAIGALVLERSRGLGLELIPEMSQGEFLVDLEWRAGTPLEQTAIQVAAIDRQVRGLDGIASVFALVGSSAQAGGTAADKKGTHRPPPRAARTGDQRRGGHRSSARSSREYPRTKVQILAARLLFLPHSGRGGNPRLQSEHPRSVGRRSGRAPAHHSRTDRYPLEYGRRPTRSPDLLRPPARRRAGHHRAEYRRAVAQQAARRCRHRASAPRPQGRYPGARARRRAPDRRRSQADGHQPSLLPRTGRTRIGRRRAGRRWPRRDPPPRPRARRRHLGQPRRTRSGRRSRRNRNHPRRLASARGLHRVDRRPERGNGPLLRQHEIRPAVGRVLGLSGDGLAI